MLGLSLHLTGCASQANAAPKETAAVPDPAVTDGDKYSVIYENALVRVLHYRDEPGAKTHQHYHRNFFLYALGGFQRRITFADGKIKERSFKAGEFAWMPSQVHTGENTGATPTDALLFEVKQNLAL